ncbi:hypothetical protein RGQ15_13775 [Paracoccus sp. MBLB3053]|uniref:DUF3311 domain-containing protein n=1 Tax=Paracoccus aurantius TaxID=3073814 RepID=A0ABU2HUA3_9RHOB|nr:hypothetical protein [Paracoccus sp. MBLB3053]MDS9468633.1 hypothetical protein [Paracoccus sp. MBLB3053]
MKLRTRRLFLGREGYHRRRMIDATRIMPVVFAIFVLLPPVWLPQKFSFATGTVWLALGWLATIALTAALHRAIGPIRPAEEDDDT